MPVSTDGERLRRLCSAALAALSPQLGAACSCEPRSAPAAGAASAGALAAGAASAGVPAAVSSTARAPREPAAPDLERGVEDDGIAPVYPRADGAPEPLAARLCEALHALPAQRKAACCGGAAGFHGAAECARMLGAALRARSVTLSPDDVGRCVEAIERSVEGCDWVTPLAAPLPPACDGIVRGALAEGDRCRSSLECAEGLHCEGAGPTREGICSAPRAAGPCGATVDALAAFTRQARYAESHPECRGHCAGRLCAEDVPIGGACKGALECGRGRRCVDGRCSDAPLPPAGAACSGGLCIPGARCVAGRCEAPRAEGAACTRDVECRAACVRPDGRSEGICGPRCVR